MASGNLVNATPEAASGHAASNPAKLRNAGEAFSFAKIGGYTSPVSAAITSALQSAGKHGDAAEGDTLSRAHRLDPGSRAAIIEPQQHAAPVIEEQVPEVGPEGQVASSEPTSNDGKDAAQPTEGSDLSAEAKKRQSLRSLLQLQVRPKGRDSKGPKSAKTQAPPRQSQSINQAGRPSQAKPKPEDRHQPVIVQQNGQRRPPPLLTLPQLGHQPKLDPQHVPMPGSQTNAIPLPGQRHDEVTRPLLRDASKHPAAEEHQAPSSKDQSNDVPQARPVTAAVAADERLSPPKEGLTLGTVLDASVAVPKMEPTQGQPLDSSNPILTATTNAAEKTSEAALRPEVGSEHAILNAGAEGAPGPQGGNSSSWKTSNASTDEDEEDAAAMLSQLACSGGEASSGDDVKSRLPPDGSKDSSAADSMPAGKGPRSAWGLRKGAKRDKARFAERAAVVREFTGAPASQELEDFERATLELRCGESTDDLGVDDQALSGNEQPGGLHGGSASRLSLDEDEDRLDEPEGDEQDDAEGHVAAGGAKLKVPRGSSGSGPPFCPQGWSWSVPAAAQHASGFWTDVVYKKDGTGIVMMKRSQLVQHFMTELGLSQTKSSEKVRSDFPRILAVDLESLREVRRRRRGGGGAGGSAQGTTANVGPKRPPAANVTPGSNLDIFHKINTCASQLVAGKEKPEASGGAKKRSSSDEGHLGSKRRRIVSILDGGPKQPEGADAADDAENSLPMLTGSSSRSARQPSPQQELSHRLLQLASAELLEPEEEPALSGLQQSLNPDPPHVPASLPEGPQGLKQMKGTGDKALMLLEPEVLDFFCRKRATWHETSKETLGNYFLCLRNVRSRAPERLEAYRRALAMHKLTEHDLQEWPQELLQVLGIVLSERQRIQHLRRKDLMRAILVSSVWFEPVRRPRTSPYPGLSSTEPSALHHADPSGSEAASPTADASSIPGVAGPTAGGGGPGTSAEDHMDKGSLWAKALQAQKLGKPLFERSESQGRDGKLSAEGKDLARDLLSLKADNMDIDHTPAPARPRGKRAASVEANADTASAEVGRSAQLPQPKSKSRAKGAGSKKQQQQQQQQQQELPVPEPPLRMLPQQTPMPGLRPLASPRVMPLTHPLLGPGRQRQGSEEPREEQERAKFMMEQAYDQGQEQVRMQWRGLGVPPSAGEEAQGLRRPSQPLANQHLGLLRLPDKMAPFLTRAQRNQQHVFAGRRSGRQFPLGGSPHAPPSVELQVLTAVIATEAQMEALMEQASMRKTASAAERTRGSGTRFDRAGRAVQGEPPRLQAGQAESGLFQASAKGKRSKMHRRSTASATGLQQAESGWADERTYIENEEDGDDVYGEGSEAEGGQLEVEDAGVGVLDDVGRSRLRKFLLQPDEWESLRSGGYMHILFLRTLSFLKERHPDEVEELRKAVVSLPGLSPKILAQQNIATLQVLASLLVGKVSTARASNATHLVADIIGSTPWQLYHHLQQLHQQSSGVAWGRDTEYEGPEEAADLDPLRLLSCAHERQAEMRGQVRSTKRSPDQEGPGAENSTDGLEALLLDLRQGARRGSGRAAEAEAADSDEVNETVSGVADGTLERDVYRVAAVASELEAQARQSESLAAKDLGTCPVELRYGELRLRDGALVVPMLDTQGALKRAGDVADVKEEEAVEGVVGDAVMAIRQVEDEGLRRVEDELGTAAAGARELDTALSAVKEAEEVLLRAQQRAKEVEARWQNESARHRALMRVDADIRRVARECLQEYRRHTSLDQRLKSASVVPLEGESTVVGPAVARRMQLLDSAASSYRKYLQLWEELQKLCRLEGLEQQAERQQSPAQEQQAAHSPMAVEAQAQGAQAEARPNCNSSEMEGVQVPTDA